MQTSRLVKAPIVLFVLVCIVGFLLGQINSKETIHQHARPVRTSGAMEALEFWAAQRAYPNKTLPETGHYTAYLYSKRALRKAADRALVTEPWRSIGPNNIGGRTNVIAINPQNPNSIYAGSASGGLWKSTTAGVGEQAWAYIYTGFTVLGVNSIAIDPVDTNIIYIGTGEVYGYQNATGGLSVRTTRGSYGIGILKTTDAGETWTKSLDWSYNQKRGVQALAVNPLAPEIIYAGTTEGTYKSNDAGGSWLVIHDVIMSMDVKINPLDTNIVYTACGNLGSPNAGIYRSSNSGANWTKLDGGLPTFAEGKAQLAVYRSSPNVVYASVGFGYNSGSGTWLGRSTDHGNTWTQLSSQDYATYQGWYSHFVGVDPGDSSEVIVGGIDIWKSTKGGRDLQPKSFWYKWFVPGTPPPGGPEGPPDYSHADHHAIAYHPMNPDTIYFGNDGGVFRTTDGGETFQGLNGGYATSQFYNGFSSSLNTIDLAIGGMQDNASAIYEGTTAWRRVIGGDGCWTAIDPTSNAILYGEYQNLNLVKSTNFGSTWFNIMTGIGSGEVNFVAPFVVSPSNGSVLYAAKDKVYKSTNGGSLWTATNNNAVLDGNPVLSLAVSTASPDTVYAATAPRSTRAGVFATTNGGTSWTNITADLPDRYPVDIAVDPNNAQNAYVALSGFGASHLFKSNDAGLTWMDIGVSLPDVPTSAVVVDREFADHIYVGNDLGVYASTDGGATWEEFSAGMPPAIVMDLSISYPARMLRVATHGNGVFERALIDTVTSVQPPLASRSSHRLEQNYPNPFNPATRIEFSIPAETRVRLRIYNLSGQEIATLVDGRLSAGKHVFEWNGKNKSNLSVSPAIYLYRLVTEGFVETKKMLLLK